MKTYNWGIVGLGGIAAEFAEGFKNDGSSLYGAASRSLQKAEKFCEKFKVPKGFGAYQEMAEDPAIDILYIATPNQQHFENIMLGLHNGKHILCEKAITINQIELEQAIALAEEKKLILAEAMTIYHMPLYQELHKQMAQGKFGALKMLQVSFGSFKEPDPKNRFFNPELAGGALLDIGTYALSFARFFLTSQPTILASVMQPFSTGVDEQSATILKNEENEMATIALTFQSKMPKRGIVAFEEAYITIEEYPRACQAHIYYLDGSTETIIKGEASLAFQYEIEHMVELVKGNLTNSSLPLTRDVLYLMDQMRAAWNITSN